MDDEFQFSAPSFHNFGTDDEDQVQDDGYFDRLRKSTIKKRQDDVGEEEEDAFGGDDEFDGISGEEGEFTVSDDEAGDDVETTEVTTESEIYVGVGYVATPGVAARTRSSVIKPTTPAPAIGAAPTEQAGEEEDSNPTSTFMAAASIASPGASESAKDVSRKRKPSETSEVSRVMKLTVPNTPNLRVLKRTRSERILSSTSLELQKIQAEREAMKKQKEKFQKTYDNVKSSAAPNAAPRSVKPLTQPVEVTFHTDSRVRPEDEKPVEPFHSFAERVLAFCNNIGHTIKAVLTAPAPFVANAPAVCKSGVTSPHPFKLATDELANKRPPLVSREDEELAAIKALKPFKARPVDPRVLNSAGDVGLVKVQRKPPTVPEPFSLESERLHRKAMEAKTKAMLELAEETKKASQFHAAPVPPSVKSGEHIAIPKPTVKAPTTTVDAPALQSDARAAEREKYEAEKAARAAEAEKAALEAAARAKAREEAEVKELRRAASFKAAPFKKNGSPHILRSTKAPTCPLTPHFQTDKRAAARNHNGLVL